MFNKKSLSKKLRLNLKHSFFSKKGISPVIAMSLLLVVSVIAVVNFQSWYDTYQSDIFSENEVNSNLAFGNKVEIYELIDNVLYVLNGKDVNVTVKSLKIDGESCLVNENLTSGINELDISSCILVVKTNTPSVVLITSQEILSKSFYLAVKSNLTQSCSDSNTCIFSWISDSWGACSNTCGSGTYSRTVYCERSDGTTVGDVSCGGGKPLMNDTCTDLSECASCFLDGQTISQSNSYTFYDSILPAGTVCNGQSRTCDDGTLDGSSSFDQANCLSGCSLNGVNLTSGGSSTFYLSDSVPASSSCFSESRTCANGSLGGSYTFNNCVFEAKTEADCRLKDDKTGCGAFYLETTHGGIDVIEDTILGLYWQKEIDPSYMTLTEAESYCSGLDGGNGWRMSTLVEVEASLFNVSSLGSSLPDVGFINVPPNTWTNTRPGSGYAFNSNFNDGTSQMNSGGNNVRLICVKDKTPKTPFQTAFAGTQSLFIYGGQGQQRNSSEFEMNSATCGGSGSVYDQTLDLCWEKDPSTLTRNWSDAVTYCQNLSIAGGSWRLPDKVELMTLIDDGDDQTKKTLNTLFGTSNFQASAYWGNTKYSSTEAVAAHMWQDTSYVYDISSIYHNVCVKNP